MSATSPSRSEDCSRWLSRRRVPLGAGVARVAPLGEKTVREFDDLDGEEDFDRDFDDTPFSDSDEEQRNFDPGGKSSGKEPLAAAATVAAAADEAGRVPADSDEPSEPSESDSSAKPESSPSIPDGGGQDADTASDIAAS